jgi:hypothetical protein
MPDLHGWITQQVDDAEAYALDHILNPANALRRCEADRKILAIHAPAGGNGYGANACEGCGDYSDYGYAVDHTNDCPTLQALAIAYGLTEEQAAQLDRPEPEPPKRTGQPLVPDALVEAFGKSMLAAMTTQIIAANTPSPTEKAIKILDPELKKIPGYVPVSEEQP